MWGMVVVGVLLCMTRVMKGISRAAVGPGLGLGPSPMQSQAYTSTGQPQINSWFSSPSQAHPNPLNNNSGLREETCLDELQAIMLNVQTSVSNMETRFNKLRLH